MAEFSEAGKRWILFIILGLPPLVYIIYVTFAQNHYQQLDYYGPKELVEVTNDKGELVQDTSYYRVTPAEWNTTAGTSFGLDSISGHLNVVSFMKGSDKFAARELLRQLMRVEENFKTNDMVRIVVMIDEQLLDSVEFKPVYPYKWKIIPMSASKMEMNLDAFYLRDFCEEGGDKACDRFLIMDYVGSIRGYFKGFIKREVDDCMGALRALRIEYYNKNPKYDF